MLEISTERRHSPDRRSSCGGGRRATDIQSRPSDPPTCRKCHMPGVAMLAGESDGGWWFVCLACDHLWDERHTHGERIRGEEMTSPVPVRAFRYARGAAFWRRLAYRRA